MAAAIMPLLMGKDDTPLTAGQVLIQEYKPVILVQIQKAVGIPDHILQIEGIDYGFKIRVIQHRVEMYDRKSLLCKNVFQIL
jgi:hypothetical protein